MNKKATVADSVEMTEEETVLEPAQQASQQLLEIRDLLFGEQLRAVHQRADDMEARLQSKLQEMNDNFSNALRELRQDFDDQLSSHKQHAALLHQQHTEQEANLDHKINALADKLQQTHQELAATDASLQAQFQQELEQLSALVQKNYNDVMAKISAASEELSTNKADRKTLAAMLASMADNLTNQE